MEDSGIWLVTVEIEEEGGQWREEGWSMGGRIEEIFDRKDNLKGVEDLELLD